MRRTARGVSSRSVQDPSAHSAAPFTGSAFRGRGVWVALALIAIDLVVYAQVWRHGFVNWDDPEYVTENAEVAGGLTWHGVS